MVAEEVLDLYTMNSVEFKIKNNIGDFIVNDYLYSENKKNISPKIVSIVNEEISPIPPIHQKEDEELLRERGYLEFPNFLSKPEVEELKNHLCNHAGYNAHVVRNSDKVLRNISGDYPFNTLGYSGDVMLESSLVLKKMTDPYILSLVASYLECFPTLYNLSSWWHFFNSEKYPTQKIHRDHDDFKFLAFFVYLTDVDEKTGPTVYYPGSHKDNNSTDAYNTPAPSHSKPTLLTGKAGTAFLADTFALHHGLPLEEGSRLVCWWRYGLYLNAMHYTDGADEYKLDKNKLFSNIPSTEHNNYLLRSIIKETGTYAS
jgi:hypothetical protein